MTSPPTAHDALDAQASHSDFLGAPSHHTPAQDYIQDALGLTFDSEQSFSYTFRDDHAFSSNPSNDTATVHPDPYAASMWTHYQDPVLFSSQGHLTVADISLPSPAPSVSTLPPLHDAYFPHLQGSPYANTRRVVPDIHVVTEVPTSLSPTTSYYDHRASFTSSPSGHAGSLMTPLSTGQYSPSPSSVGSIPPVTPESPCAMFPSPYITRPSASPISPSDVTGPDTFDPTKDGLVEPRQLELSAVEIADCYLHEAGGLLVPQSIYKPHTVSDRRRYVEEVRLEEPIMFFTRGGCGIPLKDAIASKFSNLVDRDDSMFEGRGPSVSIRLNWPGYLPWSRQIPTRDFRSPPHPITRAKLARNVAKTVDRFIKDMNEKPQRDGDASQDRWRVGGHNGIRLEDLMLVGLQHVSMGSWQAHVRLIRRH